MNVMAVCSIRLLYHRKSITTMMWQTICNLPTLGNDEGDERTDLGLLQGENPINTRFINTYYHLTSIIWCIIINYSMVIKKILNN